MNISSHNFEGMKEMYQGEGYNLRDKFYAKPNYIDIPYCFKKHDFKAIAKRLEIEGMFFNDGAAIRKFLKYKMVDLSKQISRHRFKPYNKADVENAVNLLEVFSLYVAQEKYSKEGFYQGVKFVNKAQKIIHNLETVLENWNDKKSKPANKLIISKATSQIEKLFADNLSEMKQLVLGKSIHDALTILNR